MRMRMRRPDRLIRRTFQPGESRASVLSRVSGKVRANTNAASVNLANALVVTVATVIECQGRVRVACRCPDPANDCGEKGDDGDEEERLCRSACAPHAGLILVARAGPECALDSDPCCRCKGTTNGKEETNPLASTDVQDDGSNRSDHNNRERCGDHPLRDLSLFDSHGEMNDPVGREKKKEKRA